MSVLILSLFNGILLFRQRTEQSVLYHVCPDAEGLGGTLNSALLKVGLAKKEMPCRLLVVFREIQCVSRSMAAVTPMTGPHTAGVVLKNTRCRLSAAT